MRLSNETSEVWETSEVYGEIRIEKQDRKSLAMKVTPDGVVVLIPQEVEAGSRRVREFIEAGLRKIEVSQRQTSEVLETSEVLHLVDAWAKRIGVQISRVQIRTMRTKWASCSTAGTLTLSRDVLQLPADLVDYIICHELIHLKIPDHGKGFQAMMSCHIPDWRERELGLARWVLQG